MIVEQPARIPSIRVQTDNTDFAVLYAVYLFPFTKILRLSVITRNSLPLDIIPSSPYMGFDYRSRSSLSPDTLLIKKYQKAKRIPPMKGGISYIVCIFIVSYYRPIQLP